MIPFSIKDRGPQLEVGDWSNRSPNRGRADRRSAQRRRPPRRSRCSDGCRQRAPCGRECDRRAEQRGTPLRGPARLVKQPVRHSARDPSRELSDEGLRLREREPRAEGGGTSSGIFQESLPGRGGRGTTGRLAERRVYYSTYLLTYRCPLHFSPSEFLGYPLARVERRGAPSNAARQARGAP